MTSDGGAPVIERGLCWNTTGTPTIGDNIAKGSMGLTSGWWCSDAGIINDGSYYPMIRTIYSFYGYVERTNAFSSYGYSIRCLRDY